MPVRIAEPVDNDVTTTMGMAILVVKLAVIHDNEIDEIIKVVYTILINFLFLFCFLILEFNFI